MSLVLESKPCTCGCPADTHPTMTFHLANGVWDATHCHTDGCGCLVYSCIPMCCESCGWHKDCHDESDCKRFVAWAKDRRAPNGQSVLEAFV